MLHLVAKNIISQLQGNGELFTAFMDLLIREHGRFHRLTDAEIDTTIRVNVQDGGIDTTVRSAMPLEPTGWFTAAPTAWQYKGTENTSVRLTDMLSGEAAVARITAGDAFRLAIADSLPDDKRRDWETTLTTVAKTLNPDAPDVRVITADELAAWASRYPGLVLSFFHSNLAEYVLHLEAWKQSIVSATPLYEVNPAWSAAQSAIADHTTFSAEVSYAVKTLQGEAGVGKTRLVFEIASALPSAAAVVLYCNDDDAVLRVARELANSKEARAVLVADECGAETRERLERTLVGHRSRVRVVAIDNTGIRSARALPELQLKKMPVELLSRILDRNYPQVPAANRRAYADLAGGFPRLAADLCANDSLIVATGHTGPAVAVIGEYLAARLSADEREALAAISLVTKVGYAGDVKHELDELCQFLDIERRSVERALHHIHDAPGFVARAGRYFYVTPEIVAQVAYEDAWSRWGHDPLSFFGKVPETIIQSVLDRAWRSAPEEVKRACAAFFRGWVSSKTPEHLRDMETVRRLIALTEAQPREYFPVVRRLVEGATDEHLFHIRGESELDGSWGPRRQLVWLAERFAQFPEHFDDAERILVALARTENELGISNNATGIWRQLYRVYLSGTAVTFGDRLERLRLRVHAADPRVSMLAISALEETLGRPTSRMLGPAVVGGRVPPEEWRPDSRTVEDECYAGALSLLGEAAALGSELGDAAVSVAVESTRWLLARGYLAQLRSLFEGATLSDTALAAIVEEIDAVIAYDLPEERSTADSERLVALQEWRDSFTSGGFHQRLVATVGKDRWAGSRLHYEVRGVESGGQDIANPFQASVEALARELVSDPRVFEAELKWLGSDAARSAGDLGEALGRLDGDALRAEALLDSAARASSPDFARGYVRGLVQSHPAQVPHLETLLDRLETAAPLVAGTLAISGGEATKAQERVLRMFDAGLLPPTFLAEQHFLTSDRGEVVPASYVPMLRRLAHRAKDGDKVAQRVGLDAIALRVPYEPPTSPLKMFASNEEVVQLAWMLVNGSGEGGPPDAHGWRQVLVALGRVDGTRAADYAARLLGADSLHVASEAEAALIALAITAPGAVMAALGQALLDERTGWKFFIRGVGSLLAALPIQTVVDWLREAGAEGARRIARSLPSPFVSEEGAPVVPDLTAWVLATFEDDDRTFREFAAGRHSFQIYSGDIAAQHESEAKVARRFFDHPIRRVREWAVLEEETALREAERSRQWDAESDLP